MSVFACQVVSAFMLFENSCDDPDKNDNDNGIMLSSMAHQRNKYTDIPLIYWELMVKSKTG